MSSDFPDTLKTMRQELSALLEMPAATALPEPLRTKLSAIAARLSECEGQAMQMQRDLEGRSARITALARELMTLGEVPDRPAGTAARPQMPASAPAQADMTPPTASPVAAAPIASAPSGTAATAAGRFVAEGVSLVSRSTVSPNCEVFSFEITEAAGPPQDVLIETYRMGSDIFVKTRSPLTGKEGGWMQGEDSHGPFFLCYADKIASISDRKLRMAAGFALS